MKTPHRLTLNAIWEFHQLSKGQLGTSASWWPSSRQKCPLEMPFMRRLCSASSDPFTPRRYQQNHKASPKLLAFVGAAPVSRFANGQTFQAFYSTTGIQCSFKTSLHQWSNAWIQTSQQPVFLDSSQNSSSSITGRFQLGKNCDWGSGWWSQPLWKTLVSGEYYFQYMESHKSHVPND